MSLNNIIDNILQIVRNNNIAESEHISRHQIELWIVYYRAMLIKQAIDKGYDVDEAYVSTLEPIHLDRVQIVPGKFVFVGEKELPTLINFRYKPGVIAVRDMFGNLIQLGSIYYCAIDDFCTAGTEELKRAVLFAELEKHLPSLIGENPLELTHKIYEATKVTATMKEMENFCNRYVKTLRLKVNSEGKFVIEIQTI